MTRSSSDPERPRRQYNIHPATDEEQCKEMAKLNHWNLVRARPTKDSILKVDCIFDGPQTSFEETRYGD